MWPGSDLGIKNRTATHFIPYNPSVTFSRLAIVTQWLTGEPVLFAALYWEEPDRTGPMYRPENTTHIGQALKEVDDNVGLLLSELKQLGLWGRVIVTSDHGMAQCTSDGIIRLDDCHHPDNYSVVDLTPAAAIIPNGAAGAATGAKQRIYVPGTLLPGWGGLCQRPPNGLCKLWRPRRQSASRPFRHISIQDNDVDDADTARLKQSITAPSPTILIY